MMSLKVGDQAPDFKLINSDKKEITLSQYNGKNVLILFFPAAFTGVCTDELCSIRDNKTMYDGINAEILSISVDLPFTLAKFKEIQNYNFELLSDFNKEVSTGYGCIYEEWILGFKGVSKRSAFIVDKSGKIRYAEILENAGELPNFAAINAILEEIK
jgi:glutaredoxin-dependent peroxiredoxin